MANDEFREDQESRRQFGKAKQHEKRLENATYTAAEVKVLTEAALRLGRKEAGDQIAESLEALADAIGDGEQREFLVDLADTVREMASRPFQAASDATSVPSEGPGTSEPSKAAKTPPTLVCRRCNGYGLLGVTAGVNPVPCPDCALPARGTEPS